MQSDKMCPVTLGIHKTKTSLLAGTLGSLQHQQASSKGCRGEAHAKHSNSSRIRAHATQNAVRQNAFRYLWNPLESIKTRMQAHRRQKLWISSRIQAKRMPKNSFTSPLEPIKNNKKQCWYGSETPELVRFRNTQTLAGHAKQNACQKTLSRHLWNP